jgi:predicted amidohydrolase YtcJ
MSNYSRREFLESGAALAAAIGLDPEPALAMAAERRAQQQAARDPGPDFIVINARVYTVDDDLPRAEAVAVKHGRFTAVGSTGDTRNLATRGTRVMDAAGMSVVPGFIDSHCHPSGVNELIGVNVNLDTVAQVKAVLAKKAATTPPDYWVSGYMYDDTKLDRPVTRKDLDEAVPNHPAMVGHRGGHTGVYNSKAFELAGVTVETPDPAGGKFYRENGELTGKVAERARGVFGRVGKREEVTRATRQAGVKYISEQMTKAGLTSVHQTGGDEDSLIALQDAYRAGEMRFRLYFFPRGQIYTTLKNAGIRTGYGDEWLRIGPVKYGADGSASERTMRMSTPYVGRPDDYGILTMTEDEIREAVEDAHRNDWRIGIHANGDVTIDLVLRAYERALQTWPKAVNPRHRIEHCSLVNPDLLRRIKTTGAIPTPFYTYIYYHGDKWAEYGGDKMQWMFAHRSFLDAGIPVAGASDYMPGPYEPLMALQSLVTRRDFRGREWGANQKITMDEALRVCTMNGAYASFEEDLKGSITPGKLADFVMLAEDPYQVDPGRIKDIKVVKTVVGGKMMYEA